MCSDKYNNSSTGPLPLSCTQKRKQLSFFTNTNVAFLDGKFFMSHFFTTVQKAHRTYLNGLRFCANHTTETTYWRDINNKWQHVMRLFQVCRLWIRFDFVRICVLWRTPQETNLNLCLMDQNACHWDGRMFLRSLQLELCLTYASVDYFDQYILRRNKNKAHSVLN